MAVNVLRRVSQTASLLDPLPSESCMTSVLKKCSAASLCAPRFRPTIDVMSDRSERSHVSELTGYTDVIDSTGVRRPQLKSLSVCAQGLLRLVTIRQTGSQAVP